MWNKYFPLDGEDIPVLNKEHHVYTDSKGDEYKSVSSILSLVKPKFDVEQRAMDFAAKKKMRVEDVITLWDKKKNDGTTFGTLIHDSIEKYFIDREITEKRYEKVITDVFDLVYHPEGFNEQIVFNKEKKICGTADYVVFDLENKTFGVSDFKTNIRFNFENQYDSKLLLDPVGHLPNSEYFVYALQLSFYAQMIEDLTGFKCEYLKIYWLKRELDLKDLFKGKWVRYTVPFLKDEVKDILCVV